MKIISRLLLIATSFCGVVAAQIAVEKTLPINWSFQGNPVPRFNSRLLARDGDHVTVRWFDSSGNMTSPRLAVPGVSALQVSDIASAPDGTIAISVRCADQDGRTAFSIIWLQPNGDVIRAVKMDSFIAYHIIFAPDGTLWVAGRGADSLLQEPAAYDMLRKFDASGKLLASYLPRSAGPTSWVPGANSFLAATTDRMGVYSVPDNQWIEVASNGQVLGKWTIGGFPPNSRVTGAAFGLRGGGYISIVRGQGAGTKVGPAVVTQIYQIVKETAGVSLVDVSSAFPNPATILVAGNDPDGVVVYTKNPAKLTWLRLQ